MFRQMNVNRVQPATRQKRSLRLQNIELCRFVSWNLYSSWRIFGDLLLFSWMNPRPTYGRIGLWIDSATQWMWCILCASITMYERWNTRRPRIFWNIHWKIRLRFRWKTKHGHFRFFCEHILCHEHSHLQRLNQFSCSTLYKVESFVRESAAERRLILVID